MEQWRRINERLETIEAEQRPALQRELKLQQHITLLQAQLAPMLRQEQERQQLEQQQRQEQNEHTQLQKRLNSLSQEQSQLLAEQQQLQQRAQQLSAQLQQQAQRQELVQLLLDLQQLESEDLATAGTPATAAEASGTGRNAQTTAGAAAGDQRRSSA